MTTIYDICDDAVARWIEIRPLDALNAGLVRQPPDWPDMSPAGEHATKAIMEDLLAKATACETSTTDESTAKRILVDELRQQIQAVDDELYSWNLNSLASPWQEVSRTFDLVVTETLDDWRAVAHLFERMPAMLGGYLESLQRGIDLAFPPAKRQVQTAIEQGRGIAADGSQFDTFVTAYSLDDDELASRLAAAAVTARQAFGAATDWLENVLLPAARDADHVGEARYTAAARRHLGASINLRTTYDWAWSEIARLTDQLTRLCATVDPSKSVAEVMTLLATDPDRAAQGSEAFLATMLERQRTALNNLAGVHFEVPDEIRTIDVKAPPEGGATAAYYTGPSADFSRPGTVWYPLYGRDMFPLFAEVTTAYHEGFPGHHLQVGYSRTLGDRLSSFHRLFVWHPGAGEGWALYAERLMGELGYLEKPDYEIGLVTSQLFRSCRVAIDIGSHLDLPIPDHAPINAGGTWDFDTAVSMLTDLAFLEPDDASSEVTRYLGWPGQAISYKLGEQAIVDLRAELETEPGFDLKQFHQDLLTVGAVGLDTLTDLVRGAQKARER